VALLQAADISFVDNRAQSGIIWVPFSAAKKETIEKISRIYEVRCILERRGSKATDNQPAWRIMAN
jgi:hypothetical protein